MQPSQERENTSLGYEINVAGSDSGTLQLGRQARLRQMLHMCPKRARRQHALPKV